MCSEFGLTPSARSRLPVGSAEEGPTLAEELEQFLQEAAENAGG